MATMLDGSGCRYAICESARHMDLNTRSTYIAYLFSVDTQPQWICCMTVSCNIADRGLGNQGGGITRRQCLGHT